MSYSRNKTCHKNSSVNLNCSNFKHSLIRQKFKFDYQC